MNETILVGLDGKPLARDQVSGAVDGELQERPFVSMKVRNAIVRKALKHAQKSPRLAGPELEAPANHSKRERALFWAQQKALKEFIGKIPNEEVFRRFLGEVTLEQRVATFKHVARFLKFPLS